MIITLRDINFFPFQNITNHILENLTLPVMSMPLFEEPKPVEFGVTVCNFSLFLTEDVAFRLDHSISN